jgi:hypothetical protein
VNTDDVVEDDEDDKYDDDAYESFDSEGEPHELSVSSAHSDRSRLKRTSIPGYTPGRYTMPEIHDNDSEVEGNPVHPPAKKSKSDSGASVRSNTSQSSFPQVVSDQAAHAPSSNIDARVDAMHEHA